MKDKINPTYPIQFRSGKLLNSLAFAFLFIYLFSGITLIVPGIEILFATPNVINFSAAGVIVYILLILIFKHFIKYNGLVTSLGFIVIYLSYLLASSLWAQRPDLTITALKFDLLNLFSFILFYLFSINNKIESIVTLFISMIMPAVIMGSITYVINPYLTRLGAGMFFSLASSVVLFSIFSDESRKKLNYLLLALVVVSLIVSMHKASLVSFFVGSILITSLQKRKITGKLIRVLGVFVLVFSVCFLISEDVQKLSLTTYARITGSDVSYGDIYVQGEPEDVIRKFIFNYANELIKDNWLLGIGYMNFMPKFGESFGSLVFTTVTGKEQFGVSIHNTFQAWLLEGGILLAIIVLFLLFRYFRILTQHIKTSKNRREVGFYNILIVIMIQILVFGLYHQVHQTQIVWMLLGYVFALKYKGPFQEALSGRHR